MTRLLRMLLAVALLVSSAIAQSRIEVRQILGAIPFTRSARISDSASAALYTTPEGHGLQVNWRRDSSVYAFVAHPSASVNDEQNRRAFVRQVATNAFGSDSAVSMLLERISGKRTRSGGVKQELKAGGWTLTLLVGKHDRISKLLARNATR